jgi:hypothetical protein
MAATGMAMDNAHWAWLQPWLWFLATIEEICQEFSLVTNKFSGHHLLWTRMKYTAIVDYISCKEIWV